MIFGKYFYGAVVFGSSLLLAQNTVFAVSDHNDIGELNLADDDQPALNAPQGVPGNNQLHPNVVEGGGGVGGNVLSRWHELIDKGHDPNITGRPLFLDGLV